MTRAIACTGARTRREVIEGPTSCSASSENTTSQCEKVKDREKRGGETDRQRWHHDIGSSSMFSEMWATAAGQQVLAAQWQRALLDGSLVLTPGNSYVWIHQKNIQRNLQTNRWVGCWWMSCGRSEGTKRAKAQTSFPPGEREKIQVPLVVKACTKPGPTDC